MPKRLKTRGCCDCGQKTRPALQRWFFDAGPMCPTCFALRYFLCYDSAAVALFRRRWLKQGRCRAAWICNWRGG